jgi:hypothetical protein
MKFYPVGTRVRVIKTVYMHHLLGMTGTVVGPPHEVELSVKFLWWRRTHRWVGQYVAIDGLGVRSREADGLMSWYVPSPDCIEPIEDGQSADAQVTEALTRIAKRSKRERVE